MTKIFVIASTILLTATAFATTSGSSTECINGKCREVGTSSGIPYSNNYEEVDFLNHARDVHAGRVEASAELKALAADHQMSVADFVVNLLIMNGDISVSN